MPAPNFDHLLDPGGPAGIVFIEDLEPVEGQDAIFFPPTYATDKKKESTYNIATHRTGVKDCEIDSVGSQANRVEPLFKDDPYADLVPQIVVSAGEEARNLLDVGHRAGDAWMRYSELGAELGAAISAAWKAHDHRPLAKIAPTSIVFGIWDSRGDTQAKINRLFGSTIYARDITEYKRSMMYTPPVDYKALGLVDNPDKASDALSIIGAQMVPSTGALGGIRLMPDGTLINTRRLNLVILRALGPAGAAGQDVRRYLLGLGLLAMCAPRDHNLRQGCLLVRKPDTNPQFNCKYSAGRIESIALDPVAVNEYAHAAAKKFGVGKNRAVKFDRGALNKAIDVAKKKKNEED